MNAAAQKLLLWVLVISTMVMILNETLLGVALPTISEDFHVTAATVQWLTTGFLLVMAIVIPLTGWLLQRFSTRTMFIAALVLFTLGTITSALAPVFGVLLLGRMIQAIGTAIIIPLLMTVALTIVPPERRGATMGLIGVVISVAPALGPTVSGVILSTFTWHWLFWLILPIVLLCLAVGARYTHNVSEHTHTRLDVASIPLSAVGFGGVVYGFSQLGDAVEHQNPTPFIVLALGVVFVGAFVFRQIKLGKRGEALLDMQPFRFPVFRVAVITISCSMGVLLGTAVVLPFFLQNALGASALATGLLMLPGGLLQGLASPGIGRLYDSFGPRRLVIPGAAGLLTASIALSLLGTGTSLYVVLACHMLLCLSLAFVMTPMMTDGLCVLPQQLYSHGSAILNTLQQLGGAAGTALLVATMTIAAQNAGSASATNTDSSVVAREVATATGTSTAFMVGAALALIALVTTLFTKSRPASPAAA